MMPYIFQTLVFAYCVQRELHSAGRERSGTVGYIAGRDGNGFQFDCNSRERDGMDLSQRDGTGLVMIFIPVSLSTLEL